VREFRVCCSAQYFFRPAVTQVARLIRAAMVSARRFTAVLARFTDFRIRDMSETRRPNATAPGNGAMALLLQIQHLRRAVPEQYR